MEVVVQTLEEILDSLQPIEVDWKDETARNVIERLKEFPVKDHYTSDDIVGLLSQDFKEGKLIFRLFLGLSKDRFESFLANALGKGGTGVKRYQANPEEFLNALEDLGLQQAMATETNRVLHWTDTLVERLRSGRGSAISGQRRGRHVEDFAESLVTKVFGNAFDTRCTFTGQRDQTAKCDFAIPSASAPRILIESKGYGATGSKMTDVIGDIKAIIDAKRADTAFLLFTDGETWKQRQSDLRKIVDHQNNGDITRIYTYAMAERFESDLRKLKTEYRILAELPGATSSPGMNTPVKES